MKYAFPEDDPEFDDATVVANTRALSRHASSIPVFDTRWLWGVVIVAPIVGALVVGCDATVDQVVSAALNATGVAGELLVWDGGSGLDYQRDALYHGLAEVLAAR